MSLFHVCATWRLGFNRRFARGPILRYNLATQNMNQRWAPESRVCVTDDGMVIEIKLPGVLATGVAATFEKGMLCIHGQHEDFGKFVSKFEIPANHNPIKAKITFDNGVLRIDVPSGKRKKEIVIGSIPLPISFSGSLPKPSKTAITQWCSNPHPMMIYCSGCGKHFDIVAAKGARNYSCPHCGNLQVFDLESLINQAMDQSSKMLRRKRAPR